MQSENLILADVIGYNCCYSPKIVMWCILWLGQ